MLTAVGKPTGRRRFLQSAASSGGVLILKPKTVFGSAANSAVEVGIIGCGGRGNYIGNYFVEFAGARIVALADPFRDRLEVSQKKFNVDPSRLYAGLESYRDLLDSKIDAVAVESPPYFHPEQASAAVKAGKHVYLAKPVAVDVPGCRTVAESAEAARGKLTFVVDFQTRVRPVFQEAASRVHSGTIGTPVLGHVYYHASRLQPQNKPGISAPEARLRNWVFDKALSGDIIVEQNVHVLDMANWYLRAHPVQAAGTGGRKGRTDVGDAWDHFLVSFWYPDGVKVDFSSAQFTQGYNDLCARIYGTAGTLDSHYGGFVRITGQNQWDGTVKDETFNQGAITNVKNFVNSIKTGQLLNNAAESVESTLTAVLGRIAAYGGGVVTWDEMMRASSKVEANMRL
jgi:myo-inositol 2-dehydrogenase/D-chiro-inositol 1-dehydrogenase